MLIYSILMECRKACFEGEKKNPLLMFRNLAYTDL